MDWLQQWQGWLAQLNWPAIIMAVLGIHVVTVLGQVLMERRRPSATLAWIFTLTFLPLVGVLLYWLIGATRSRRLARRSAFVAARVEKVLTRHDVNTRLAELGGTPVDSRTEPLLRLGQRLTTTPASSGNTCEMLVNAAASYRAIINAIEAAKDHIHVEFYIIQPDVTGQRLRDRLSKRAAQGIEVRVLYDAVGGMALPTDFWGPLIQAGGRAAAFRPVSRILNRLRRRDRVDFRNHRKIVVVDGHVGFTGGINVGTEYLGLDPEIGHWRDTHVRIEGPAVLSLQETFAEDWLTATGDLLEDARYFPDASDCCHGPCAVQIVDSGPDRTWSPISHIYLQAIALARERVWITSPYFIPSAEIETGLVTAALRGVDLRLLLPRRADHYLVTLASRSYYEELLEAGVRIFEYQRGFVHAKTMVVDTWVGTIGSANMDMRSFHLNFEVNAFIYGEDFTQRLAKQFLQDLESAHEVDLDVESNLAYPRRLVRAGARLLSPLL